MRKTLLAAMLVLGALAGEARAQEQYIEGPVWQFDHFRIKPDKGDAYLKFLRQNWLPQMAEMKKQGLVLDYKIFLNTARHDEKDWDVAFATLYPSYAKALDYSSADEEKLKGIAARQFKTKDEAKQIEQLAPRLDWREFVGTHYVREITLKPLP
jgi:hypothetical protein